MKTSLKIGTKVKVKATGEIMEIDNVFDDGDILVGVWDCGSRMVKVLNPGDIEVLDT